MTDSQESNPVPDPTAPVPMAPGEVIHWTDWPARHAPGRAALAAALVLAVVLLVARFDAWLAPAAALVLLTATSRALLPGSYRVDARGVRVRRLLFHQRLSWDQLDRAQVQGQGLRLFPREARPWLARARSLSLPTLPIEARARILAAIASRPPA